MSDRGCTVRRGPYRCTKIGKHDEHEGRDEAAHWLGAAPSPWQRTRGSSTPEKRARTRVMGCHEEERHG
jgi:hypothetical protein